MSARKKPETGFKVLVVEDSLTQAMGIRQVLESAGYNVLTAGNGRDALDQLPEFGPDAVLTDIIMPEMDGFELCRRIKSEPEFSEIRVIMLTSRSGPGELIRAMESSADAYVTKPYMPDFLLSKVSQTLSEGGFAIDGPGPGDVTVTYGGSTHSVTASKAQIVEMMICTYEDAAVQNQGLRAAERDLEAANSKLRQINQELTSAKESFRSLVMTVPDIVYRIDSEGRFTFLNNAITRLGYDPRQLLGHHFSEVILPGDVDQVSRDAVLPRYTGTVTGDREAPKLFDERRTGNRRTSGLEVRLVVKSGSGVRNGVVESLGDEMITVEVNSSGLYETSDEETQIFVGTVGVIRDITDRKELEGELIAAQESLEKQVQKRTLELVELNSSLEEQIRQRRKMEEELKELLKRSQDSQARLVQAEKMSALGTVVSGVAHELNNPMMSILNYVQYAAGLTAKDDKRTRALANALHETKRCIGIVQDLETFSRLDYDEEEPPVTVQCSELFARLLGMLSYRIEREGVQIVRSADSGVPPIRVQQNKFQQLFLNILTNALDSLKGRSEKRIEIESRLDGQMVLLQVADTGSGIDPEVLPRVYDPFFTTKPEGSGVGLGLSVGRAIVEAHGGTIDIKSAKGSGTVVSIRLPAHGHDGEKE